MIDSRQKKRGVAGFFGGVGAALITLAIAGARPTGQRVLYLIAGIMFMVAALIRLRQSGREPGARPPRSESDPGG